MSDLTGPAFSEELKQAIALYRKTNWSKARAQRLANKRAEDLVHAANEAYKGTPEEWSAHWKAAIAELEQRDPPEKEPPVRDFYPTGRP